MCFALVARNASFLLAAGLVGAVALDDPDLARVLALAELDDRFPITRRPLVAAGDERRHLAADGFAWIAITGMPALFAAFTAVTIAALSIGSTMIASTLAPMYASIASVWPFASFVPFTSRSIPCFFASTTAPSRMPAMNRFERSGRTSPIRSFRLLAPRRDGQTPHCSLRRRRRCRRSLGRRAPCDACYREGSPSPTSVLVVVRYSGSDGTPVKRSGSSRSSATLPSRTSPASSFSRSASGPSCGRCLRRDRRCGQDPFGSCTTRCSLCTAYCCGHALDPSRH